MMALENLGEQLRCVGRFMGLLTPDGSGVNTEWFARPVEEMSASDRRLEALVDLLALALPQIAENPPQVFPNAQWHPIPNPEDGRITPLHLVIADGQPKGEIGAGVLHSIAIGQLKAALFVYFPMASHSRDGAKWVAGSDPLRIGVDFTTEEGFRTPKYTFRSITLETRIFLAGIAVPEFRLTFLGTENEGGAPAKFELATLQAILENPAFDVLDCLNALLLAASYWVNLYIGGSRVTIGAMLKAAGFLTVEPDSTIYRVDRDRILDLRDKPPEKIALAFLFAALNALSELQVPLLTLPGGGLSVVRRRRDTGSDYGLKLTARITVSEGIAEGAQKSPAVDLCAGQWLPREDSQENWVKTCGESGGDGLLLLLLREESGNPSFAPTAELGGVGFDVAGPGDAMLFDINGYSLKSAQVRSLVRFGEKPALGFAIYLGDVAFPFGPNFEASQQRGGNAVVSSLLASGESGTDAGSGGAVNPAFSAKAAYVKGQSGFIKLFDPEGNQTDLVWFPIQRRFGPLDCKKIGLLIKTGDDPVLGVAFDGAVKLPSLEVRLDQLTVGMPLKRITDVSKYQIDLEGMGVAFESGSLSLSAGLFKVIEEDKSISYDGDALLRFQDLTIAAIGSFSSPAGIGTSMFVFAMMNKPLGGPAFFFVTGLAAGFGYNRGLRIPEQDEVGEFPLIAAIDQPQSLTTALTKLREGNWIPAARGEYWLAAGIQFTTFRVLNSIALVIVQFGKELIITILGTSTLKQGAGNETYVYAKLGIRAVFRPEAGEFLITAVLDPGSYVLRGDAHLTGGFALAAWFAPNSHAGDFVCTIGGYHPAFNPPAHYPRVPRVGINWKYSDQIQILGECYFAMTPAAMMAGGALQATFVSGPLRAWLKARIDLLVYYRPFYMIADAAIAIGVSYRVQLLFIDTTLSVELGASFSFWGPPVGFTVHVDWYIISFTVGGGQPLERKPLKWSEFKDLLPGGGQSATRRLRGMLGDPAPEPSGAISVAANKEGLATEHDLSSDIRLWLVRPGSFQFTVGSSRPSTSIVYKDSTTPAPTPGIPIAPRRILGDYRATLTIRILDLGSDIKADDVRKCLAAAQSDDCGGASADFGKPLLSLRDWERTRVDGPQTLAMWRTPSDTRDDPGMNPPSPNLTGTSGATLRPLPPTLENCTPQMVIEEVFANRTIFEAGEQWFLPISRDTKPVANNSKEGATFVAIAGINTSEVTARRAGLLGALRQFGFEGFRDSAMDRMAKDPGADFADEPREGTPIAWKGVGA